jgi:hypothetical protein
MSETIPIDSMPIQITPHIVIADVASGGDRAMYGRQFLPAFYGHMGSLLTDDDRQRLANYVPPDISLIPLADPQADIAHLPAMAQSSLRQRATALEAFVAPYYYLPPDEQIISTSISCLKQADSAAAAGTLAYIRTTNRATIYFMMPFLSLDLASGDVRFVNIPPPLYTTGADAVSRPATLAATGDDVLSTALSVSQSLVWVMPPPWGPVAAGAISLVQMLLGGNTQTDALTLAVQQLEAFIQQQQVNQWAGDFKTLADWLNQEIVVTGYTDPNITTINTKLLPPLRQDVGPLDGSVYNNLKQINNGSYLQQDGVFDILVQGVSVYLLAMKFIIQLDATVASLYNQQGDSYNFNQYTGTWLNDYADYVVCINGGQNSKGSVQGWASIITNEINTFTTQRLSQIGQTERGHYTTNGYDPGTKEVFTVDHYGWTFIDKGAGDNLLTHFVGDTTDGSSCCSKSIQHKDQADAARASYIDQVSQELDAKYQNATQCVASWQQSIQQWNDYRPPLAPTTAPTIDPNGWQAVTPQGAYWVDGHTVQYAIGFANAHGPSPIGPWSDPTSIQGKAFPTLNGLATDPLSMAEARWIYRAFDDDLEHYHLIDIVGDNTTTTYPDKKL